MAAEMEWTVEQYRLDEVADKFDLPCVIHVNEGYYSDTDTEGFSQGDIMSIDSKMVLHKVAANFAFNYSDIKYSEPDDIYLIEKEILVPLNYRGKLKVLQHPRHFDSVRELACAMPRYAKVGANFKVKTEDNVPVTIQAGAIIELDRIIPGSQYDLDREQDKLVLQFKHVGKHLVVAVPMNVRGKFITEPDNNEYTIKEAIDRYSLPQDVRFLNDEIKRVYTQDLLEGIENMRTITETLRLNRIVTQNVLVGHYKPLDDSATNDTERFRQRTLIVLPIDNPEIREVEVNVLKGITEDIYEHVFLVRNVSNFNTEDIVDGSLYVDFAMTPSIKRITAADPMTKDASGVKEEDIPPPRPPKPRHLSQPTAKKPMIKPKPRRPVSYNSVAPPIQEKKKTQVGIVSNTTRVHNQRPPSPDVADDDSDEYEFVETSPIPPGDYACYSLADLNFNRLGADKSTLVKKTSRGKDLLTNIKSTFKGLKESKDKGATKSTDFIVELSKQMEAKANPRKPIPEPKVGEDETELQPDYDEVIEWKMVQSSAHAYQSPPRTRPVKKEIQMRSNRDTYLKPTQAVQKPTARVTPSHNQPEQNRKLFRELNNDELVERLQICDLHDMARLCKTEKLDGAFFQFVTQASLKEDMKLEGLHLIKFMQMRDGNWAPS